MTEEIIEELSKVYNELDDVIIKQIDTLEIQTRDLTRLVTRLGFIIENIPSMDELLNDYGAEQAEAIREVYD